MRMHSRHLLLWDQRHQIREGNRVDWLAAGLSGRPFHRNPHGPPAFPVALVARRTASECER